METKFRYYILAFIMICTLSQISSHERSAAIAQSNEKQFMFCMTYGCSPYQYVFADADERDIQLAFLGPDTIVVRNTSLGGKSDFSFVDKYQVRQLDDKHTYCVIKLASSSRSEMIACRIEAKLPFHAGGFVNSVEVFPFLSKQDTIFLASDLSHVQIRDFSFLKASESFNDYIENGYKLKPIIKKKMWEKLMEEYRKQKRENAQPWALDSILQYCDEKYLR